MTRDLRLPIELAALREIRRRAAQLCYASDQAGFQARLADLRQSLDRLERLEQEAARGRHYELLPPPNVLDLGE